MKQEFQALKAKFRSLSNGAKVALCTMLALACIGGPVATYYFCSVAAQMGGLIEDTNKIHAQQHGGIKFGANVDHSTTSIHGGHTLVVEGDTLGGFMSGADKTKLDGIASNADVTTESSVRAATASFSADPSFNSHKITSLADGTASSDSAAFHQIADAVLAGKANAVDAVSSSNLTLSGTQTVDGVALVAGNRCLAYGQTTTTQDGCYVVAAGAWARCSDFPTGTGAADRCFVARSGTSNKGVWCATNASGSDVIGTADLVFTNVAAGGGGGAVSSVFGRTGTVTATSGDYTFSLLGPATGSVTFSSGTLQQLVGVANSPGSTAAINARYLEEPGNWTRVSYGSDFDKCSGAQSTSVYCDGMIASLVGTLASSTIFSTGAVDDTQIGVIELTTGSTATGTAAIISSVNVTSGGTLQPKTSARVVFDCRGRVPTLSTSAQAFTSLCGWIDSGTPANGFWFSNDSNANTHWMMNVGSGTQTATTVTVTAGQYYHLVGIKQAGGDCVDFYVDGVQTGTCVGTVATSTNVMLGAEAKSSVGTTTKNFDLDWVRGSLVYQRAN